MQLVVERGSSSSSSQIGGTKRKPLEPADVGSAADLHASFGLTPDMIQHPGVILMHNPASQGQPVKNGIEFQLVRGVLDDIGAIVVELHKFEAREGRSEVADDVRGM